MMVVQDRVTESHWVGLQENFQDGVTESHGVALGPKMTGIESRTGWLRGRICEEGDAGTAQGATQEEVRWLGQLGRMLYVVERGITASHADWQERVQAERRALLQGRAAPPPAPLPSPPARPSSTSFIEAHLLSPTCSTDTLIQKARPLSSEESFSCILGLVSRSRCILGHRVSGSRCFRVLVLCPVRKFEGSVFPAGYWTV
jgi:hypothetical protein